MAELLDLLAGAGFDDVRVVPEPSRHDRTRRPPGAGAPGGRPVRRARRRDQRALPGHPDLSRFGLSRLAGTRQRRPRPPLPRRLPPACSRWGRSTSSLVPGPVTADDGAIAAAAEPQLVTVATPREASRSVAVTEEELVAERAARTPIAEPVEPLVSAASGSVGGSGSTRCPHRTPCTPGSSGGSAAGAGRRRGARRSASGPAAGGDGTPAGAVPVQHIPAAVPGPVVGPPAAEPHPGHRSRAWPCGAATTGIGARSRTNIRAGARARGSVVPRSDAVAGTARITAWSLRCSRNA